MDDEAFFDRLYSQFCVPFPCYALRRPGGAGWAVEEAADGTRAVVVLTDPDLVRRYHAARGLGRHPRVALASPAALARFLGRLPAGVTHVTFDPGPGFHRRYPAAVVRAAAAPAPTDARND